MRENYTFKDVVEMQVMLLGEARKKLDSVLEAKVASNPNFSGIMIKNGRRGGRGIETRFNDRRMYIWIECQYKGKEYDITLFQSEIDKDSGNCHCQIGKVMFVKGYLKNKGSVTSPNSIFTNVDYTEEGQTKTVYLSDEKQTFLVFNSHKWGNPLDYFADKNAERLANGKWITVDDILDEKIADEITDAFLKFISEDTLNVPISYLEYAAINGFAPEMWDKKAEMYYNKLASLLNQFSIMKADEYDDFSLVEQDVIAFDLTSLLEAYIKNKRVSKEVAGELERLIEDEIYPLGADYGFLFDIVLEIFLNR